MSGPSIRVSMSREQLRRELLDLPRALSSGSAASDAILTSMGLVLLANIREAFVIKARGGTDDSGLKWAPLRPSTIARRRKAKRAPTKLGSGKFGSKAHAQQTAVSYEILRDTGLLLNSLTPGYPSPDQVFEIGIDSVTVGTTRAGAADHHNGDPARRLPQRRLWPEPENWPDYWWEDMQDVLRQGIIRLVAQSVH